MTSSVVQVGVVSDSDPASAHSVVTTVTIKLQSGHHATQPPDTPLSDEIHNAIIDWLEWVVEKESNED